MRLRIGSILASEGDVYSLLGASERKTTVRGYENDISMHQTAPHVLTQRARRPPPPSLRAHHPRPLDRTRVANPPYRGISESSAPASAPAAARTLGRDLPAALYPSASR